MNAEKPLVGIVMGSDSDWPLVKKACDVLDGFGVAYETRVISAHRTPEVALEYSRTAEARGLKVVIAAAGGAAHLGAGVVFVIVLKQGIAERILFSVDGKRIECDIRELHRIVYGIGHI